MRLDHKLPQGWRMEKLGEVADVDWGNTSLTKSSYANTGFTAFSATGPDGFMSSFEHDEDAVVLSAIGANCGKCFFATGKWTAIKNTIVIRSKGNLLPKFFFYISNQPRFWKNRGAAQPFISLGDSRSLQIPLPPLPTQRKIVEILDVADTLRRKRREADAKMKDLIPAIFVKMFGDPATNPRGWAVKKLGDVCHIVNGKTPLRSHSDYWSSRDIPWFTIDDIRDNGRVVHRTSQFISNYAVEKTGITVLPENSVLLCCTASIGEFGLTQIRLATNQQFNGLIIKEEFKDKILPEYLFNYAFFVKSQLERLSGTTSFKFVPIKSVSKVQIPLPPCDLQTQFINIAANIEEYSTQQNRVEMMVHDLFDSLSYQAFRGELVA